MIWFILVLLLILLIIFFRDVNPYKLIMIFGKKGSGKTTYIAKMCLKFHNRGYVVYSNVPVPFARIYNPSLIGINTFPPNSIVFCDEVGLIWNNREYKSFQKCVLEWFKYQRQYKIRMYLFSQAFDIDKKLRDLTDVMFLIKRLGKFSILRPIYKQIGISQDVNGNGNLVDCYKFGGIFSLKFTYIPRYVGLFNSYNPPELAEIGYTDAKLDEFDTLYLKTFTWLKSRFMCALEYFRKKALCLVDLLLLKIRTHRKKLDEQFSKENCEESCEGLGDSSPENESPKGSKKEQ